VKCAIYKGTKKDGTYLFVEQKDNFSRVSESLLSLLGPLKMVMQLDLTTDTRLAQVSANDVIKQLHENGFYIQLPPSDYK
jgi:hypothetical protein